MNAFHIARSGLQMAEMNLAVKTMNIAGQGADAFKKQYLIIFDLPYRDESGVGTATSANSTVNPTGTQIGLGVQSGGTYRDFSQGESIKTDNSLDVLIDGDGFFEVQMPDGSLAYTRVGAFQLDGANRLVMPFNGYPMAPGITIPSNATQISINALGQIYVIPAGSTTEQLIGQLQIATFFNPSGLKAIGDSMFVETSASGTPDTGTPASSRRGRIKQGWREGSNVNAIEEMTDLIRIEKIYDMLTKVLKTGDTMWSLLTQAI
jgi:flagellar basal-body rod protein FlgG